MTLTIIDCEQGSEEWHTARRGIVTASTVGRLITPTLKVANNDTSRDLTRLLVAERISGWTDPTYQSDDMFRGVISEPIARDHYSGAYQQAIECGFMLREENGWKLGYSPDGLVGDEGLIEIKAPRTKEHLRTILADEVPAQYMPQLQAGLLVSGREWIDYVSFCGGLPLYVKRVTPDPAWHAAIIHAVTEFEETATVMTAVYKHATAGLPATERLDYATEEIAI